MVVEVKINGDGDGEQDRAGACREENGGKQLEGTNLYMRKIK